jgi:ribosomal protein S18 acetylase RimI-like enzyme
MDVAQGSAEDLDAVMDVITLCVRQMRDRGSDQWDDFYPTREILAADIARGELSVLRDGAAIVGAIVLNETQSPEYADLTWQHSKPLVVHRLCVRPERQGTGAAGILMNFAEARALESGHDSIRLDTYTGNPRAILLYERRGYRLAGYVRFRRRKLPFMCFELALQ